MNTDDFDPDLYYDWREDAEREIANALKGSNPIHGLELTDKTKASIVLQEHHDDHQCFPWLTDPEYNWTAAMTDHSIPRYSVGNGRCQVGRKLYEQWRYHG